MPKNFIELNGKRYDALSGKVLSDITPATASSKHHKTAPVAHKGTISDITIKPHFTVKHTVKSHSELTRNTHPVHAHQPQRAKTLMRHVVHKPEASELKTQKPVHHIQATIAPNAHIAKIDSRLLQTHSENDENRALRAGQAKQHHLIHKFHSGKPIIKSVKPLPVQTAPVVTISPRSKPVPKTIFEQGLERATSHQQPFHTPAKTPRRFSAHLNNRFVGFSSALAAAVLLVAFVVYLNLPQIYTALASSRAGFAASTPAYKPTGFKLSSNIASQPGQITLNYQSPQTNQEFSIVQQTSNWDSPTLKDYISSTGHSVTATNDEGHPVYLLDGNQTAMWVSGGVLYKLTGNAALTTSQIDHIAASM